MEPLSSSVQASYGAPYRQPRSLRAAAAKASGQSKIQRCKSAAGGSKIQNVLGDRFLR